MKYFVYTIITIVAATIVAGFFIVGSPKTERMRRFDDQRVSHLQVIQSEIVNFWINKSRLPKALDELTDSIRGFQAPTDPESQMAYDYKTTGVLSFELCASFNLPSEQVMTNSPKPLYYPEPYGQENWNHDAGKVCFARTIDQELYKPAKR